MGKLADYELKKLGQQAVDFFEDTRDIINLGKVAHVIVNAVPAWKADNGEMAFYDGGTSSTLPGKRIYVRLSSSWEVFATAGNASPASPEGAIQFNSSNFFGGQPELVWDRSGQLVLLSGGAVFTKANQVFHIGAWQHPTLTSPFLEIGTTSQLGSGRSITVDPGGNVGIRARPTVAGRQFTRALEVSSGMCIGNSFAGSPATSGFPNNGLAVQGGILVGIEATGILGSNIGAAIVIESSGGDGVSNLTRVLPKTLQFGTENDSDLGSINWIDQFGNNANTTPRFEFNIDISTALPSAFFFFNHEGQTGISRENPAFVSGADGGGNSLIGTTFTYSSGSNIVNHRHNLFFAPTLSSTSASVATSVSNAATVFIEGPPVLSNSLNVINNYALWIGTGDIKVGGSVITGGNTTLNKNGVFFTTTAFNVSSNNAADTTLIRGIVGTTSLVANTLSDGRTIRLQAWGYYNTPATPDTLQMRVKLGGTTILTTGAQTPAGSVSTAGWSLNAHIVCQTTGGAGTVFAQGDFPHFTAPTTHVNWQMVNSSTTTLNTTGANVVEITAQWGGASSASQIFMTQAVGELLN